MATRKRTEPNIAEQLGQQITDWSAQLADLKGQIRTMRDENEALRGEMYAAVREAASVRAQPPATLDTSLITIAFQSLQDQSRFLWELITERRESKRQAGRASAEARKGRVERDAPMPGQLDMTCENCRAAMEGRQPKHSNDLTRHLMEHHAERKASGNEPIQ